MYAWPLIFKFISLSAEGQGKGLYQNLWKESLYAHKHKIEVSNVPVCGSSKVGHLGCVEMFGTSLTQAETREFAGRRLLETPALLHSKTPSSKGIASTSKLTLTCMKIHMRSKREIFSWIGRAITDNVCNALDKMDSSHHYEIILGDFFMSHMACCEAYLTSWDIENSNHWTFDRRGDFKTELLFIACLNAQTLPRSETYCKVRSVHKYLWSRADFFEMSQKTKASHVCATSARSLWQSLSRFHIALLHVSNTICALDMMGSFKHESLVTLNPIATYKIQGSSDVIQKTGRSVIHLYSDQHKIHKIDTKSSYRCRSIAQIWP